MNYEKLYKNLVENIKNEYEKSDDITKKSFENILPELIESKEEKTRKSLLSFLYGLGEFEYPNKQEYNDWLIWLESGNTLLSEKELKFLTDTAYKKGYDDGVKNSFKKFYSKKFNK